MDWTSGYVSDIEYTSGFYREQSPAWLNFVCLLNGIEPVDLQQPFTYFELGFGRGLTAQLVAASHPNGQFYAADFNPAHVAGASALAKQAQLSNLTLLESASNNWPTARPRPRCRSSTSSRCTASTAG